jgi:hypothetical protein
MHDMRYETVALQLYVSVINPNPDSKTPGL